MKTGIETTGLTVLISARVNREQKRKFKRKAQALGLNESELLRSVVLAVIDQNNDPEQTVKPDADNANVHRITLRIPKFLNDNIAKRAKAKGMLINRWLTALIQSNLTGEPVMTDTELVALRTSNRELAAIGRNINQIAKVLNRDFFETEQVRISKLAELSQAVTDNRNTIRSLIKVSQNAWEAD